MLFKEQNFEYTIYLFNCEDFTISFTWFHLSLKRWKRSIFKCISLDSNWDIFEKVKLFNNLLTKSTGKNTSTWVQAHFFLSMSNKLASNKLVINLPYISSYNVHLDFESLFYNFEVLCAVYCPYHSLQRNPHTYTK